MRLFKRLFLLAVAIIMSVALSAVPVTLTATERSYAHAATISGYHAQTAPVSVTVVAGETAKVTLTYANDGTSAWTAGKSATAAYLYGVSSKFKHSSWLANDLPAIIKDSRVASGGKTTATFTVQAPAEPGMYTERFLLSYGPNQWMKGSTATVTFLVLKRAPVSVASSLTAVKPESVPVSSQWKAQLVDRGGIEWQLSPGERITAYVTFKNIGTQTWTRGGGSYLSLYTWAPKYRKSSFKDASWKGEAQAGFLVEEAVKPGQTGRIKIDLVGPNVPGTYQETFQLAAENAAWVDGGSVTLPLRVIDPQNATLAQNTAGAYSGMLLLTSNKNLMLIGGKRQEITLGFKNAGTAAWGSRSMKLVSVAPELGAYSSLRDDSWPSTVEAVRAMGITRPGEIGFVSYTIKAPAKKGDYKATFALMADDQDVEGGIVEIPITVTEDGYIDPAPIPVPTPVTPATPGLPPPLTGDEATLPDEPIIRVGLYKTTDNTLPVRGIEGKVLVKQGGVVVCTIDMDQIVTLKFDYATKSYTAKGAGCDQRSTGHFVIEAADGMAPLEVTDISRPVSWLPGANDNKFRAKIELRYASATDKVWVINELPLETYLKGIAETSNVSPLEFQKALLTAARTYALYHQRRATKHANEFFHVDATYDQVYRGYGQEARSPNIVDGIVKTRGQIVTYEGKLAVTPYYSRSDGRTRDWTEVWGGGAIDWLKSVPVPEDIGQTLWGHGVGMSARGALYMAKAGKLYDVILKHFYVGTSLGRAYK